MDAAAPRRPHNSAREDAELLARHEADYASGTADRLLAALVEADRPIPGERLTRLDHSLQAASRAWADGADIDWVVAALLHDVGEIYAPYEHDEYSANLLKPYVREQCSWVVARHGDFQLHYYGRRRDADPARRKLYEGHPFFADCVTFCERWDKASLDPDFPVLPLEHFAPMAREVFARRPWDPAVLRAGARVPLTDAATAASR
jgi:predicted HD phosphohydrolase